MNRVACSVRARVSLYSSSSKKDDEVTAPHGKSDVFVLSAPKKKERSLKTKRDKKKVPCGKKVQPL